MVVSAAVLGLARFARDVSDGPPLSPGLAWLVAVAVLGALVLLGVVVSLGLGRLATTLHLWGRNRAGPLAWAARGTSALVDILALGLLMAMALGVTLFLVMSAMILMMTFD